MKQFPTVSFGDKPDYSGFDSSRWPLRDVSLHRQKCFEHLQANIKLNKKQLKGNIV